MGEPNMSAMEFPRKLGFPTLAVPTRRFRRALRRVRLGVVRDEATASICMGGEEISNFAMRRDSEGMTGLERMTGIVTGWQDPKLQAKTFYTGWACVECNVEPWQDASRTRSLSVSE